jgi:proline iminopeptidase
MAACRPPNFAPGFKKQKIMNSKAKIQVAALAAVLFFSCAKEQPDSLVPPTVDQDAGLPSITVNGVMLHAEAFGHPDSPLVVCLHGGPGSDYRSMLNARELAGHGYRVVFYDQRGSGLSQRLPRKSYTGLGPAAIDAMYDELSGVIAHYRTHPGQKVFLLGHSWGGILASGYAGRYPQAVAGLAVGEPGGLTWADITDYVAESRSFKLWSESLNDATYLDQFMTGKEDQHEILDYKMCMQAIRNDIVGEDNTAPGSFWRSGAVINAALFEVGEDHAPDFSIGLKGFAPPVLFLYSEYNKAYPDAWAQRIASAYASVTTVKIPQTGHGGIIGDVHAWQNTTRPRLLAYFDSLK